VPVPAQRDTALMLSFDMAAIIGPLAHLLRSRYVFPQVGARVAACVEQRHREGAWDAHDDPAACLQALTALLREASGDRHLRVGFTEQPQVDTPDHDRVTEQNDRRGHCERLAFGIERVERLPLNIGLLVVNEFVELLLSMPAVNAAMTLLAHVDALIIDVRRCVGGDPETVAWLCSHLFDRRVQLSTLVVTAEGREEQHWTSAGVAGPRLGPHKPVRVLTSHFTFSGAEMLAYDLQALQRARVVGEVTGGGAHACQFHRLTPHVHLLLPECRPVNPVTGGNWEGVGVQPDLPSPQHEALEVAQRELLQGWISQPPAGLTAAAVAERLSALQAP